MFRFLGVSVMLMVSYFAVASADVLTSPKPRDQKPTECACLRAPCDCERFVRDIERQRGRSVAYSHCTGAVYQQVILGGREVCAYPNVSCLEAKSESPREYAEVSVNAVCGRPLNGECPRPRDLTDCVNSDDVSPRDADRAMGEISKVCESVSASNTATARQAAPARRNQ